jgi:hypothetical protein
MLSVRSRPNRSGQAYALGLLVAVAPGEEGALRHELRSWPAGVLRRATTTHFARWVVVDHLSHEVARRRRQQLARECLLFTSVFDLSLERSVEAYLTHLTEQVPATAGVWEHCEGFPSPPAPDPSAIARWLMAYQVHSGYFFAPYGKSTVHEVRDSLAWAARVRAFAVDMQRQSPDVLQAAFAERLRGAGDA